jgi:hypothetical protein
MTRPPPSDAARRLAAYGVLALWLADPIPAWSADPALGPGEDVPAYGRSRFEEDYRHLADPARRTDFWDPIKYLPLGPGPDTYLSLGGELRERYEYFHRPDFGLGGGGHDDHLLQRLLLHADLHLGTAFRAFVQLGEHEKWGGRGPPGPTDEDRPDLQQAFVDGSLGHGPGRATLRVGRQEMAFGSQRLVSVRESPNVRRSFDGFRAFWQDGGARLDAFLVRPVRLEHGTFDDRPDEDQAFWGVYGTAHPGLVPGLGLDLYYLGLDSRHAVFGQGVGHEERHTVGARLFGRAGAWDYDLEGAYQFGSFGHADVRAWTVASDTGRSFEGLPWRPRVALKADVASGDGDPGDGRLGTFNPLFPKGAYFSEASINAPANFYDLYPYLDLQVARGVSLTAGWDFLWRYSEDDAFYAQPLSPLIPAGASDKRYVGSQATLEAEWKVTRHLSAELAYVHFFAGGVVEDAGGKDVDFLGLWADYKF